MTIIKRHTLFFALSLLAFSINAFAQTPAIEVSTDNEAAEFSARGETRKVQVEVYAPSGELVFETADSDGQSIRWAMVNRKGERVADGVYLATITVVDSAGKKRKRIEQITVSSERQTLTAAAAGTSPTPDAPVTTTVNGTAGRLAKFTGASTVGNSAVTEGAGKIGVNIAPSATLQINGLQPAPLANNGTNAPVLLQTTGGKGGNTTAAGKTAGAGASISLVAGNGGDGPSGSFLGKGGSITLQPGSGGTVPGAGGKNVTGNILLAPSGVGNVGVGTTVPASVLHVVSAGTTPPRLQSPGSTSSTSFAAGWDFYHGTVGKGYVGVPGKGVGSPAPGEMLLYGTTGVRTSLWAGGTRALTVEPYGSVIIGSNPNAETYAKLAVYGTVGIGTGDPYGGKLHVIADTSAPAGYFDGDLRVTGTINPTSDRAAKTGFEAVDGREILARLAGFPIRTWSYKADRQSARHMGPTAQDFAAAFQLGRDDKSIATVDVDGVALASIQALYQLMLEKDRQITQQNQRIKRLEAQLNQVRRAVRRGRAARR
ncbi:MAG TPA: tail fiber domain-containing protein [Pyrinomonadaceae bacterium]|nr:tail fiber domain-containing protein [Pyrinomonadaceae bacterium]